jgi:hypothetical protein
LAWKIVIAVPPATKARGATPLTFFQSATFQAVNPKILIWEYVKPYGRFDLDMDTRLDLP